jgi:hypothetical protein
MPRAKLGVDEPRDRPQLVPQILGKAPFGRRNKSFPTELRKKWEDSMGDQTTRCKKCGKRMLAVITIGGRTDLQCISCDDPAVKWAESPAIFPEEKQPSPLKPRLSRLSTGTP